MIPTFSLERTQELLYDLSELVDHQRLPHVPIYLDSPLAINALSVYRKYTEYYDKAAQEHFKAGEDFFNFPGLIVCRTREESKRINMTPGPKIIIAGAGMMNGGRIVHHALRYLSDDHNTLLIVGYQAQGTLGRQILDGQSPVKVLDESVQVRCQVKAIGALSAHADQAKLTSWVEAAKPKRVFLNHGELDASTSLAQKITALGINTELAKIGLSIEV
jgi:metallo-beta-lactamase family protein